MNAIIVVNIGGRGLTANSRASMQDAADRWGVEYVEVTRQLANPTGHPMSPYWAKVVVWRTAAAAYERVLVLDSDMLIRADCPSPFDVVPIGRIGVVSRYQWPTPPDPEAVDHSLVHWAAKLGGLKVPPPQRSMNGGFALYEPATHAGLLRAWEEAGRRVNFQPWHLFDQASLSVLLYNRDVPQTWLPHDWNTVGAGQVAHAPLGPMATWIYHFTGTGKRARINRCEWRVES